MLRKSNSDTIELKVGHVRLLCAFIAGCVVTFTVAYFFFGKKDDADFDWDDGFDPIFTTYRLPELSTKQLDKIKEDYGKPATCEKTADHPDGCAYVTLITKDEFLELGLVLGESIRASNSKYSLVALVGSGVSSRGVELLTRAGIRVVKATPLPIPPLVQPWREYWRETYLKLRMFGLSTYERLVYLDADSLVMLNMDELFLQPGEFMTATDRHLCKHETTPGASSMISVLWPSNAREKEIVSFFNDSGYVFSRGDQSVTDDYFSHRKSASLLNESWSSFVFRCQCDDFEGTVGSPGGPKSVHFTGWFRPHVSHNGVSIPAGLSAKAKECGKAYYDHWEAMWRGAMQRQGLNQEEFWKESIRPVH